MASQRLAEFGVPWGRKFRGRVDRKWLDVCTYVEKGGVGTGSVAFDENMGATFTAVAGLRAAPVVIPEPATAVLGIAALLGLAARRRR